MGYLIAVMAVVALAGIAIYGWVYSLRDHWSIQEGQRLRKDARIIDVKSTPYNKYKYKTVVTFDDGFQYTAFDTKSKGHILWDTISVTSDMKKEIMGRALFKHEALLAGKG